MTWTLADGLKQLEDVSAKPDESKGWATLRERAITHPFELLSCGKIAPQMLALLGQDVEEYRRILSGPGVLNEFRGDDYVGAACAAHNCGFEEAMVYLSAADRKAFVAWKPYNENIIVRPAVTEWSSRARRELKTWADQLK